MEIEEYFLMFLNLEVVYSFSVVHFGSSALASRGLPAVRYTEVTYNTTEEFPALLIVIYVQQRQ